MSVRQYVGARYVPRFSDVNNGIWSNVYSYEPLIIVKNGNDFYTSKKSVPVGIQITNTEYWIKTGDYNGAIIHLQEEIDDINSKSSDYANVKNLGVYGDGVHDDTAAIQAAIDDNTVLIFPAGTYLISSPIEIHRNHYITGYGATIKATANFSGDYMIIFGSSGGESGHYAKDGIEGLTLDCSSLASGLLIDLKQGGQFSDIRVQYPSVYGIRLGSSTYVGDVYVSNCLVESIDNNTVTGLYISSSDNTIDNFRTMATLIGIDIHSSGNTLNGCHPCCYPPDRMTNYSDSIACIINSQDNLISNFYADGYQKGFDLKGFENNIISCFYMTFPDVDNFIMFEATNALLDNIDSPIILPGNNSTGVILKTGRISYITNELPGRLTGLQIRDDKWRDCITDKYTDRCLLSAYNGKYKAKYVTSFSPSTWNVLCGVVLDGTLTAHCKLHISDDNLVGDIYFDINTNGITLRDKNIIRNSYTRLKIGFRISNKIAILYYSTNANGNYITSIECDASFGVAMFSAYDNRNDNDNNRLQTIPSEVGQIDLLS